MAVEEVIPDEPPVQISHPESYSKLPETHTYRSTRPNVFTRGAPFCLTDANQSSNETKHTTVDGTVLIRDLCSDLWCRPVVAGGQRATQLDPVQEAVSCRAHSRLARSSTRGAEPGRQSHPQAAGRVPSPATPSSGACLSQIPFSSGCDG